MEGTRSFTSSWFEPWWYESLKEINPALLDDQNARENIISGYYKLMKKIAEVSNQNLVRNSDAYLSGGGKTDPDNEFQWIDDSYKLAKEKFQLTY